MTSRSALCAAASALVLVLAGCGGGGQNPYEPDAGTRASADVYQRSQPQGVVTGPNGARGGARSSVFDLFRRNDNPNTSIEVNRYIWNAALEVLDFLPVRAVDPFSGVIVTGYGAPPGGGRAYRATIYVQDPALDARSLNLALATRSGPVDPATVRTVENAILTRARELRIRDAAL